MSKRLLRLLAVVAGVMLFASACGSDDSTDAADTEDTTADAAMEDEDAGGAASDEDTAEAVAEAAEEEAPAEESSAGSIADLEAEWAAARAGIVAELSSDEYGVGDDNVLRGPGGFELDLSSCPADWSETGGIEDGTITIGHTIAQSGSLAVYGNIATGMGTYFNYVNENGGIGPDGLQLELIVKDDAYDAAKTQEFVAELMQTEDPFFITTLGSPNTFSVYNVLNEACIPQPMVQTGHQAWGDPVNHPWTTGLQMSYATESLLWGSWIEQNLDGPVTVAALVMDNDFGLAYEQGFEQFVENSDHIEKVDFVRHDPQAATLTNEITTLASKNADVFISMTAGNPCLLAIQEAARAGITGSAQAFFTPSVCKAVSSYMTPAGDAANGWLIAGGGWKDNTDPQYDDDTYISWMNQLLADAGLDGNSLQGAGVGEFGWSQVQALQVAAELPGGLTRSNLILAVRGLSMEHPALLDGIAFEMNGAEDSYLVEGSDISLFDASTQQWNQQGGVIDLNGKSNNCPWESGVGC